jgi:sugar phosphate isomerase/epimerase
MGGLCIAAALPRLARAAAGDFFTRHRLPLGVQIYSVADLARLDMGTTLKKLAQAGYQTTELAGYLGQSPLNIRRLHDEAGLKCVSAHVKVEVGTAEEPGLEGDLSRLAEQMHQIGVSHVIAPGFPIPADVRLTPEPGEGYAFYARVSKQITPDHWKARAAKLNAWATTLKSHGLKVGYHNHSFEFSRNGTPSGMDVLLMHTDRSLVTFELDIGWAFAAGVDPASLLRANPGRFHLAHLKDMQAKAAEGEAAIPRTTEVGSGLINWKAVLDSAYDSGTRGFFVEQEPPFDKSPLESMALSAKFLKSEAL